jgi:hypothetical protein
MSDASFTPSSRYGQTGMLLWLCVKPESCESPGNLSQSPAFLLHWSSVKKRRIANSSLGAEILAASQADDYVVGLTQSLTRIFSPSKVCNRLLVDSRSLYHLVSTFRHSGSDPRLAAVVDRLRESFLSGALQELGWIPDVAQLADGLTK